MPGETEVLTVALEGEVINKIATDKAIREFNAKPKKGIAALSETLGHDASPEEVATFLYDNSKYLDPKQVGEYFGDPDNMDALKEYLKKLDFQNMGFNEALRLYLAQFNLPGEAQKIDRLVEVFAEKYFEENQGLEGFPFTHQDGAYVLAFSTIMLNTDLHSPQIKNKITEEEFIRNNRGIDNGNDLPQEFLQGLYNNIKENEMDPNVLESKSSAIVAIRDAIASLGDEDAAKPTAIASKARDIIAEKNGQSPRLDGSAANLAFQHTNPDGGNTAKLLGDLMDDVFKYNIDARKKLNTQKSRFGIFNIGRVDQQQKVDISDGLVSALKELQTELASHPEKEGEIRQRALEAIQEADTRNEQAHKGTMSSLSGSSLNTKLKEAVRDFSTIEPPRAEVRHSVGR